MEIQLGKPVYVGYMENERDLRGVREKERAGEKLE